MDIAICSFSFHQLLNAGKQDMFKYITDCKELGCTMLDPWNAHFVGLQNAEVIKKVRFTSKTVKLSAEDEAHLKQVKVASEKAGLPFGCIAVDGPHIYEPTEEVRKGNRSLAYYWLTVAERLDARQVRIDAGGPAEMPNEVFKVIIEGYKDLVDIAGKKKIELLMENHWGPSPIPENVVRIMEAVKDLGLLFDTNNWATGMQQKGWQMCTKYAKALHIKTFAFDKNGNETSVDISKAIRMLVELGYKGCWSIESCPKDGDEYEGARKTIALIRKTLRSLNYKS